MFGVSLNLAAHAQDDLRQHECPDHVHLLEVQDFGYEHVSHQVKVNKQVVIRVSAMWFVEKISCTEMGFQITVSHAQYGDLTEQIFNLVIEADGSYTLSER